MNYEDVVRFHGHRCPGLAMGYRMSRAALEDLGAVHSGDEELVAIVENDACGVDAVQYLTGCTFGKGNLIFRDHGKQVYTIYSRTSRLGVRVVFHGKGIPPDVRQDRPALAEFILSAPDSDLLSVSRVTIDEPEPARIRSSVVCDRCGEPVMETRVQKVDGTSLCIPCSQGR
jgi:formylmethanofuran dehydrogenase subunit E